MKKVICYCHNHTNEDLQRDVVQYGRSTILEKIIAESKAGNCSCEVRNPKGK